MQQLDLTKPVRNVHSMLGFPCDVMNIDEAIDAIDLAIEHKRPCFISTPNLNWIVSSFKSPELRESVCQSDLSLIDGMPLMWIARALRLPFKTRVPGSTLFERLASRLNVEQPIKVFFFGGSSNAADLAMDEINRGNSGVHCVDACNPGMGTVEELSTPALISRINDSNADMLILALGAIKGQKWIQANRHLVSPPVITHLGAVVNFTAGTVIRSPKIFQQLGLEWAWRIKEEPYLWRRYAGDAFGLAKLSITKIAPLCLINLYLKFTKNKDESLVINETREHQQVRLELVGQAVEKNITSFVLACRAISKEKLGITLDCRSLNVIDSAFIAQVQLLQADKIIIECRANQNSAVGKMLRLNHAC